MGKKINSILVYAKNICLTGTMDAFIFFQTEGSAHVGKTFDVLIKLVNPLAVPMTNGHIHIEGPGMQRISSLKVK